MESMSSMVSTSSGCLDMSLGRDEGSSSDVDSAFAMVGYLNDERSPLRDPGEDCAGKADEANRACSEPLTAAWLASRL